MKKKSKSVVPAPHQPSEDEIRDYAYHLFEQSGRAPGHDLENWLEAKACLEANIPKPHARARLHRHRHPESAEGITSDTVTVVAIAAEAEVKSPESSDGPAVERIFLLGS